MALPVVRLAVVDQQRVVSVTDARAATLTMYLFLKSVATPSECAAALSDMTHHLHGGSGFSTGVGGSTTEVRQYNGVSSLLRGGAAPARTVQWLKAVEQSSQKCLRTATEKCPLSWFAGARHPPKEEDSNVAETKYLSPEQQDDKERQEQRRRAFRSFFGVSTKPSPPSSSPQRAEHLDPMASTQQWREQQPTNNNNTKPDQGIVKAAHMGQYAMQGQTGGSPHATSTGSNRYGEGEEHVDAPPPLRYDRRPVAEEEEELIGRRPTVSQKQASPPANEGAGLSPSSSRASPSQPQPATNHYLLRVLKDVQDGLQQQGGSSTGQRTDEAGRQARGQLYNKGLALLTRIEAVRQKMNSSNTTAQEELNEACLSMLQRVRNVQVFYALQQHEKDTLQLTDVGLQVESTALKRMLRDVIAALVRSEARLTGEDTSLPPSDPRYVAEHGLFETVQDALQTASNTI